ncbi:hypothetical protein AALA54_12690 [Oscillospiraceae bacterium 44-34]
MKKKMLSLALALALCLGLTPFSFAENGSVYTYQTDEYEITNVYSIDDDWDGGGPGRPASGIAPMKIIARENLDGIYVSTPVLDADGVLVDEQDFGEIDAPKPGDTLTLSEPGDYFITIFWGGSRWGGGTYSFIAVTLYDSIEGLQGGAQPEQPTGPALAAEESLTRLAFARLLDQYAKPEGGEAGELPPDCAGLSEEDRAAVTAVCGAGWMYGDGEGNFLPDETVSCGSAISVIARILDPELEFSTMPKLPEDRPATEQELEEDARLTQEWTEKMQALFHAPAWLCQYVEVLYNKGVIQSVALEDWGAALRLDDAEGLLKAAFAGGEGVSLPAGASEPEQPTGPVAPPVSATALPTNDTLTLNGVAQNPTVFKLDGGDNYFKIRDLAAMLNGTEKQFAVGYDGSVQVTTGQPYEAVGGELAGAAEGSFTAEPTNDVIYIDGVKADLTAYKIEGNNFFRLRDLGRALDFYVGWTAERGVFIETDRPYAD